MPRPCAFLALRQRWATQGWVVEWGGDTLYSHVSDTMQLQSEFMPPTERTDLLAFRYTLCV